jgi:hypothetical protein
MILRDPGGVARGALQAPSVVGLVDRGPSIWLRFGPISAQHDTELEMPIRDGRVLAGAFRPRIAAERGMSACNHLHQRHETHVANT